MSLELIFKISLAENVYFVSEGDSLGLDSGFYFVCIFMGPVSDPKGKKTGPVANSSCHYHPRFSTCVD